MTTKSKNVLKRISYSNSNDFISKLLFVSIFQKEGMLESIFIFIHIFSVSLWFYGIFNVRSDSIERFLFFHFQWNNDFKLKKIVSFQERPFLMLPHLIMTIFSLILFVSLTFLMWMAISGRSSESAWIFLQYACCVGGKFNVLTVINIIFLIIHLITFSAILLCSGIVQLSLYKSIAERNVITPDAFLAP